MTEEKAGKVITKAPEKAEDTSSWPTFWSRLPEETQRGMKAQAAIEGVTVQVWLRDVVEHEIPDETLKAARGEIAAEQGITLGKIADPPPYGKIKKATPEIAAGGTRATSGGQGSEETVKARGGAAGGAQEDSGGDS